MEMRMTPIGALTVAIVLAALGFFALRGYLRRRASSPEQFSRWTQVLGGAIALLTAVYMGVMAVVLDESRAFHIALSVLLGLGGLLILRAARKSRVN